MALFAFILLISSTIYFYVRSKKSRLRQIFSLLSFSLTVWSFFLFICDFKSEHWSQKLAIQLITLGPIFIPILLTYIIINYTYLEKILSPPIRMILAHGLIILRLLYTTWDGTLSPFILEGEKVVYKGNVNYYFFCAYLVGTIFWSLLVIWKNIKKGNYFVRLHSLYMATGILFGFVIAIVLSLVLPNLGISLNSISVFGLLIFLWTTWIPLDHNRLFTEDELLDFRQEIRNPRLSNLIIYLNRYLLNVIDPVAYKEICEEFEKKRQEELCDLQVDLLTEFKAMKDTKATLRGYANKMLNLFFR